MTGYRFLGTTDESTECERCGRTELRSTVMLIALDAEGNDDALVYFGSSCAAKALSRTGRGEARKVLDAARSAHRKTREYARYAREFVAFYAVTDLDLTDATAVDAFGRRFRDHHMSLPGYWHTNKPLAKWTAQAVEILTDKRRTLADAALLGV